MAMVRGRVLAPVLPAKPDVIPNGNGSSGSMVPQQQVQGQFFGPTQVAFSGPVRIGVWYC